jgi:hypothetical protein
MSPLSHRVHRGKRFFDLTGDTVKSKVFSLPGQTLFCGLKRRYYFLIDEVDDPIAVSRLDHQGSPLRSLRLCGEDELLK